MNVSASSSVRGPGGEPVVVGVVLVDMQVSSLIAGNAQESTSREAGNRGWCHVKHSLPG